MVLSPITPVSSRWPAFFRRAIMPLSAFCFLIALAVLSSGAKAQAEDGTCRAGQAALAMTAIVVYDAVDHHDHGAGAHDGTEDFLSDFLTLGHCHAGCPCAGLPPGAWRVDVAMYSERPTAPWHDLGFTRGAPNLPFRPPIL
jgi:hypothetical protein